MRNKRYKFITIFTSKYRFYILILLVLISSALIALALFFMLVSSKNLISRQKDNPPNIPLLASRILNDCNTAKIRQRCYEKQIPKLMNSPYFLNMQQGFEVMELVQQQDKTYGYCHVTAHYLSEQEVRKNPENWKNVITKCPEGSCSNGCIHGVFMERFQSDRFSKSELESLSKELRSVCLQNEYWQPTRSESNGCFHALGHTTMYLTNANTQESLDFCNNVVADNNKNFIFSCYQGLFMQIFQPLEAEDKVLVSKIRPTKDTVSQFCSKFTGQSRVACMIESWPYYYPELKEPETLALFCESIDKNEKRICYSTVINILTSNSQIDLDFMNSYCSRLKSPTPGDCLGYVAVRLLHIDIHAHEQAINVCKQRENMDESGECYQRLIKNAEVFLKNPEKDRKSFCSKFPSYWQQRCLMNK